MSDPRTSRRPVSLLLALLTAVAGATLTGELLAASSPPAQKRHPASTGTLRHAPSHSAPGHSTASKAKAKTKLPEPLSKAQRKAPTHARVAANSKAPKRAQQAPAKPRRAMAKNSRPAA